MPKRRLIYTYFFSINYIPSEKSCNISWSSSPVFSVLYVVVVAAAPMAVVAYCYAIIFKVGDSGCTVRLRNCHQFFPHEFKKRFVITAVEMISEK